MYNIIVLMGKSGAGKDTILKALKDKDKENIYNFIVSTTSRPPREGEKAGIDYNYIDKNDFLNKIHNNEFLEYTGFKGWYYGTPYSALKEDKINIGVFNPSGLFSLLKLQNVRVLPVLIDCSDKERLIRQLEREHNPDIDEIIRRYTTDRADFQRIPKNIKIININNGNDSNMEDVLLQINKEILNWTER